MEGIMYKRWYDAYETMVAILIKIYWKQFDGRTMVNVAIFNCTFNCISSDISDVEGRTSDQGLRISTSQRNVNN